MHVRACVESTFDSPACAHVLEAQFQFAHSARSARSTRSALVRMSVNVHAKTPVQVAMFLKENGVSDDICELFEGM